MFSGGESFSPPLLRDNYRYPVLHFGLGSARYLSFQMNEICGKQKNPYLAKVIEI
jgi:hypothetical protein